jgi:U1 small nuclear ribonucleoprotein C
MGGPRFYCDYCDMYLTHDSAGGRRQHRYGWKHRDNVRQYYEAILKERREEEMRAFWESKGMAPPPMGLAPPNFAGPPPPLPGFGALGPPPQLPNFAAGGFRPSLPPPAGMMAAGGVMAVGGAMESGGFPAMARPAVAPLDYSSTPLLPPHVQQQLSQEHRPS